MSAALGTEEAEDDVLIYLLFEHTRRANMRFKMRDEDDYEDMIRVARRKSI